MMRIIISPAKKMRRHTDFLESSENPVFLREAGQLCSILSSYSMEELKTLFGANDEITRLNYERYRQMDLSADVTLAVLAYVGLQYQSMAPEVFTSAQWDYVKKHLNIISGFYGVLSACDGVVPYRLEMQAKLPVEGAKDLYGFWGSRIYRELVHENDTIINLASKEYSKAVEPWVGSGVRFISCVFGTELDGKVKVKATEAKIARGEMVRWMAEQQVEEPEQIKAFRERGYHFSEQNSTESCWVFVKEPALSGIL